VKLVKPSEEYGSDLDLDVRHKGSRFQAVDIGSFWAKELEKEGFK
jgi:hypothetical protein